MLFLNEEQSADAADTKTAPRPERRSAPRHRSVFKACAIARSGAVIPALLRDLSENGAQIQVSNPASFILGERIRYFWDGVEEIDAIVMWSNEQHIGVSNRSALKPREGRFPPRMVRIDCRLRCRIFVGDHAIETYATNISQTGLRFEGDLNMPIGTLATVDFGSMSFCNVALRWSDGEAFGMRFPMVLNLPEIAALVSRSERTMHRTRDGIRIDLGRSGA